VVDFILASGSPRRKDLLLGKCYQFRVEPAGIDEWPPGTFPFHQLCEENAALKAGEVSAKYPKEVVLGADTLVGLEGEVMGKPGDLGEAACMLARLSGRVHEVCTGVCLRRGEEKYSFFEVSRVRFRDLNRLLIEDYLGRVNVLDKAGAYAVQEHGEMLVDQLEGAYDNVVGLPMSEVSKGLARFGVAPLKS
tara:strand:- start:1630 stop:2205 length:576 start_codon:yes stop_codon:yes gene_type:complete